MDSGKLKSLRNWDFKKKPQPFELCWQKEKKQVKARKFYNVKTDIKEAERLNSCVDAIWSIKENNLLKLKTVGQAWLRK